MARKKKKNEKLGKKAVRMPRLGCNQAALLLHLRRVGKIIITHGAQDWPVLWESKAGVLEVLTSLMKRGLVTKTDDGLLPGMGQQYVLTKSGETIDVKAATSNRKQDKLDRILAEHDGNNGVGSP